MDNDQNEEEPIVEDRLTRKKERDDAHAEALALAYRLGRTREEWFVQVPVDDDNPHVGEQLRLARGLKPSGAKKRLIHHVARLLKDVDLEPLREALDQAESGHDLETVVFHATEAWRDRLLAERDDGVEAFLLEYPDADRQQLRQLVRQAHKERKAKSSPKASRALFKLVRAHVQP